MEAIKNNNVEALMKSGIPHSDPKFLYFALEASINYQSIDVLKYIFSLFTNRTKPFSTLTMFKVIKFGFLDAFIFLIEQNALPIEKYYNNALSVAVSNGQIDIIKFLHQKYDIDYSSELILNSLVEAARQNHITSAEFVLNKTSDLSPSLQESILMSSAHFGNVNFINLFAQHYDIKPKSYLLERIITKKDSLVFKTLLSYVNEPLNSKQKLLSLSVDYYEPRIFNLLINSKPLLPVTDQIFLFNEVMSKKQFDALFQLTTLYQNELYLNNIKLLKYAVDFNLANIVSLLLTKPMIEKEDLSQLLSLAISKDHKDIFYLLLSHPSIKLDSNNNHSLQAAALSKNTIYFNHLYQLPSTRANVLCLESACYSGNLDAFNAITNEPQFIDFNITKSLELSSVHKNTFMLETLINKGLNFSITHTTIANVAVWDNHLLLNKLFNDHRISYENLELSFFKAINQNAFKAANIILDLENINFFHPEHYNNTIKKLATSNRYGIIRKLLSFSNNESIDNCEVLFIAAKYNYFPLFKLIFEDGRFILPANNPLIHLLLHDFKNCLPYFQLLFKKDNNFIHPYVGFYDSYEFNLVESAKYQDSTSIIEILSLIIEHSPKEDNFYSALYSTAISKGQIKIFDFIDERFNITPTESDIILSLQDATLYFFNKILKKYIKISKSSTGNIFYNCIINNNTEAFFLILSITDPSFIFSWAKNRLVKKSIINNNEKITNFLLLQKGVKSDLIENDYDFYADFTSKVISKNIKHF